MNVIVPWLHDVDAWFEERRGGDGENAETNDGDNGGQQVVATGDQEPVDNRVDNRTSRSLFQVLLYYKLS